MVDYQTLFSNTDTLICNEAAICRIIRKQGEETLLSASPYLLLFVLQGSVKLDANEGSSIVNTGNLISLDKSSLQKITCSKNTMLLEYTPVELVCKYFKSCKKVFKTSCSSVVPILPAVDDWIKNVLRPHSEKFDHMKADITLTKLLLEYPKQWLGELYIPFYAYHLHRSNIENR